MPKHKDKDCSHSRSRSHSRSSRRKHKDRSGSHSRGGKKDKNRSSSRSIDRHTRRERKSKFDIGPSGEITQRKSKWSDQPPSQPQSNNNILFDTGIIKITPTTTLPPTAIDSAITINPPVASTQQNSLQKQQAQLFSSALSKSKIEPIPSGTHIETIRPNIPSTTTISGIDPNVNPLLSLINPINTLGVTLPHLGVGSNTGELSKIKRKIYVPKDSNFNYTGLIIGPKGSNQKRLEEETGCKILVRGKGSQKEGQPPQPDDNEEQHVLIIGDSEMQIAKATAEIERIIFADEETRIKIRQEQLKTVAALKNDLNSLTKQAASGQNNTNLSLTTPYGPPSPDAFIIPVPNDCVGLVIGKGGETIKQLQAQSGAKKVQVAADSAPGSGVRNVFVEGDREAYERVKKMLNEIVEQQRRLKQAINGPAAAAQGAIVIQVPVPDNLVGLIIGKGGETIKGINQRSGSTVYIPKECEPGSTDRILVVTGDPHQVEAARQEIMQHVEMGRRNLLLKQLQSQGLPPFGLPLVPPMQMDLANAVDPNLAYAMYCQQYLNTLDPNYAPVYQQMYVQQPIVETIVHDPALSLSNKARNPK